LVWQIGFWPNYFHLTAKTSRTAMINFYLSPCKFVHFLYTSRKQNHLWIGALLLIISTVAQAQVSGTVFRDFNANGQKDGNGEIGVGGIVVTVHRSVGAPVSVTTSTASATLGQYSLTGLGTGPFRIQFSNFPSGYFSGPNGSLSKTTVQFLGANGGVSSLGINYPEDYCQSNPVVMVPCYVNGDPTINISDDSKEAGLVETLVSFPYSNTGLVVNSPPTKIARGNQIGAVWGLTYQKASNTLYAGALMKRHVGFGKTGAGNTGIVYRISNANGSSGFSPVEFFRLSDYGIDAGTDPHSGLSGDKSQSSLDAASFDAVGRVGLGDLDLSEDGETLYLINLKDKKLYSFDIGVPGVAPNKSNATEIAAKVKNYTIPDPQCSNAEFVPWGLKFYRGKLYVGVVCTAQTSQNKADLKATVYEFNPSTGSFTNVLFDNSNNAAFSLNFKRGSAFCNFDAPEAQADWRPWKTTNVDIDADGFTDAESCTGSALIGYAQPILSDIEFDADGSMIVGFSDRFGNQSGRENEDNDRQLFSGFSQGDILRAGSTQGGWKIENNGVANGITGGGPGNQEGPGGGEFYGGVRSNGSYDPKGDEALDHPQAAQGGIALRLGAGQVMTNFIDPSFGSTQTFWSGGIRRLSNFTGKKDGDDYQLYNSEDPITGGLGKANGLGDLEVLCGLAPIEIGNRVWNDANGNGIQDPTEAGINGVTVLLFKKDINGNFATQVATQTTSGNGEYYFTNLEPNTEYEIRVNVSQATLSALKLTPSNIGSDDAIDNDASLSSGNAVITLTTGNVGANNHTYDLGFNACPSVELTAVPACVGATLVLNATGTNIATYSWAGPASFSSTIQNPTRSNATAAMAGTYSITVANSASCTASATTSSQIKPLPTATASSNTPVCAGGSIQLSASGGTGYTWAGPNGFSSIEQNPTRSNATTSMTGTYSVVVAGSNSCTASATTSVTVNPRPSISTTSFTACEGGTVTIGASGGATYSWSGPEGFTSTSQNPTRSNATTNMSGTYSVTVVSSASCTATGTATVSVTPAPQLETQTVAFCPGGSASLSASGGATYSWNTGATTSSITVTTGGTYSVTITAQNGCKAMADFEVTEKPKPVIDPKANTPLCVGETLQLSASGGGTYNWVGPANFISTAQNPTRPDATTATSGVYTVLVTGTNSCTNSATISVVVNRTTATASANSPVCVGSTLTLSATGGGTYAWAGPDEFASTAQNPTRSNATTAMAGIYSVTVTKDGCTATATTSVTINNQIAVATSNSPICQGGPINLSASAGASYAWAGPGGFTASVQNPTRNNSTTAMTGIYSVTVGGQNSCTGTATTSVVVNPRPTASITSNSPVCTGLTINLSARGGQNFTWAGPAGFSSSDQNPSVANTTTANAGVYSVTVGDENACTNTATASVVINVTTASATSNAPVCIGGSILLSATGGGTYSWAGPAGFSSTAQNPLRSNSTTDMGGIYSVTVTRNGCTATATTSVAINTQGANAISNGPLCVGNQLNLSASAGTAYSWSGPAGFSSSIQAPSRVNVTTAMAGVYIVAVTGSNGCTGIASVSVVINERPVPGIENNNPVCEGNIILLSAFGGVSYSWAGPNDFTSTDAFPKIENASSTNAGIYSVTIENEAGCTATTTTSVLIKKATATASATTPVCVGQAIKLSATGGTTYSWAGPDNFTSDEQNPTIAAATTDNAGVYSVTVQDADDCTASTTVKVEVRTQGAEASSDSPICVGTALQLSASEGETYAWAGPANFSSSVQNPSRNNATTAMAGVYSVTVKGTSGCTGTATTSVVINPKPTATASSNTPVCEKSDIVLKASGGETYSWAGPSGFSSTLQSPVRSNATTAMSGVYTVTVTDEPGCTNTATTSVRVRALPTFEAEAVPATCVEKEVANNAKLLLKDVKNGDRVGYSFGDTYTGPSYAGAMTIPQNGLLVNTLPNPEEAVSYTIRFFNASNDCFTDVTVTLQPGVCNFGSLGDFVWVDNNNDGLQSDGEPGVRNVKIILYAGDGTTKLDSTFTDNDGKYLFDSLETGAYIVRFVLPKDFDFAKLNQGSNDAIDSDAGTNGFSAVVNIDANGTGLAKDNPTVDAGIVPRYGSLGDFVWSDIDSDGQQGEGEPGVKGINVVLYQEIEGLFVPVDSMLTDANGKYLFDSLRSDDYRVQFKDLPENNALTVVNVGNDATDSDAGIQGFSQIVNINVNGTGIGRNNLTVDAGIIMPYGSIGDFVWKDLNANGIQESNEPGLNNITVVLYKEIDKAFVAVDTTVTNSNGAYLFDFLLSGNYKVRFVYEAADCKSTTPNSGNDDAKDSDAGTDGFSSVVNINTFLPFSDPGRNNKTIDAGFIFTYGSLGDFVWSDDNKNGLQDDGETGVAGVKVILYKQVGELFVKVDSTFTNGTGKYLFDSLLTGKYQVQFVLPKDKLFTNVDTGSDDQLDSDAGTTGFSPIVTIDTSKPTDDLLRNNPTIDAGLIPACVPPSIKPGPDREICLGESTTILAETSKGVLLFWYTTPTGGTPFDTTGSNEPIKVAPTNTTDYFVEAAIKGQEDCKSERVAIVVKVNAKPAEPTCAGNTTNDCPAKTVDLTALQISPLSIPGGKFEWRTGINPSSPLVADPAKVGAGKYYLFEKSPAGCYSDPALVVVNIIPCECEKPATADAGKDQRICGADTVFVSGKITNAETALWSSNGTGVFGNAKNLKTFYVPSAEDAKSSKITLTLTTIDSDTTDLCKPVSDALIVTFLKLPEPPFNVSCSDSTLCRGDSTKLFGLSPGNLIRWYTTPTGGSPVGEMKSGESFAVAPQKTTTYYAEAVSPEGCVSKERTAIEVRIKVCYADLEVIKKVLTPGPYKVGQEVTYSVTVNNLGPVDAKNVKVIDKLPASLSFVSAIPPGVYDATTGTWTVGDLSNTASRTFQLKTKVLAAGIITNVAYVTSPDNDPSRRDNDTSRVSIVVEQADLRIQIKGTPASVFVGDEITYTIEVKNSGPNTATGVEIKATLPAGLQFVSSSSLTLTGNVLKGTITSIDSGTTVSFTFKAKVLAEGSYTVTTEITKSDLPDPDSTPNNGIGNGEDDQDSFSIKAQEPCRAKPPVLSCTDCHTICIGQKVVLYADGCEGIVEWSTGDTGPSITVAPTANTTYWATCVLNKKCRSEKVEVPIKVGNPKAPVVTCSDVAICNGKTVNLTAAGCTGEVIWSNGYAGSIITVKPKETTNYYAYCKVGNCLSERSNVQTVTVTPPIAKPLTQDLVNECPQQSVNLFLAILSQPITTGGVFEFHTGADPSSPKVPDPKSITKTGTYYVFERSVIGCYSEPCTVHVLITECNPVPPCVSNPATADAGPDAAICADNAYKLSGKIGGAASSAKWSTSGKGTFDNPFLLGATYTASQEDFEQGYVYLVLSTNDPDGADGKCTTAVDSMKLLINGVKIKPTITVEGSLYPCHGDSVKLTANPSGYGYLWTTGQTTRSIWVKKSGTYNVRLVDKNGCMSLECDPIEVKVGEHIPTPICGGKTNTCPATTVDLNTAVSSKPATAGGVFEFHTGILPTSPIIVNPSAVGAGTYYVFERSATGCYSAPSTIVVSITDCKPIETPKADLSLRKLSNLSIVEVGKEVIFTLQVKNSGPDTATNVVVTDFMPDGLTFVSGSGVTQVGNNLKVSFARIAKNDSASVAFVAKVTKAGDHTNKAEITAADQTDPDSQPNSGFADGQDDHASVTVSCTKPDTIVTVKPPVIGLAKRVKDVSKNIGDNTWTVTYEFVVKNYGTLVLNQVQVIDSLSNTFASKSGGVFSVITKPSVSANSLLTPNPNFNGTTDNRLLLADKSVLVLGKTDTLRFTVKITPGITDSTFYNTALATAVATFNGQTLSTSDVSTNGTNPDPSGNGVPFDNDESKPTPLIMVSDPVGDNLFIPQGFSPNGDGINDLFVIQNVPTETTVTLKIYNVWGNMIYSNDDYKNDWTGNASIGRSIGSAAGLPDGTYYYLVRLSDGRLYIRAMTIAR
jgi:uncharacterized repeat protein (TIGR01451 family)/gliding motility-associated-like protein